MGKSLFCCLLALSGTFAHASEGRLVKRVLKDSTTMVLLDLNAQTVFCTERGYGSVQLKISVPELDELAHFDHRVVGESLPCITGGECTDDVGPGNVIRPDQPTALVPLRVILTEQMLINDQAKTCVRNVAEEVKSYIRDREFTHHRWSNSTNVAYEKCVKLARQ